MSTGTPKRTYSMIIVISTPPAASVFRTAVANSDDSAPPQPLRRVSAKRRRSVRRISPLSAADSLQQPRETPVLQYSSTRLLLRAVAHDVVLEVDRLDPRAAARAFLAGAPVHLERHRHLVGDRVAHDLLVVVERAAEHLLAGRVERLDLLVLEVGALLKRREPGGPQQLVHPGATDPGNRALVAQQRMEVTRLVEQRSELLRRGRRI